MSCLNNEEQMGEGWSDYFGLMLSLRLHSILYLDMTGTALAALAAYTVTVVVTPSAALTGVPATDAMRIDVHVSYSPGVDVASRNDLYFGSVKA